MKLFTVVIDHSVLSQSLIPCLLGNFFSSFYFHFFVYIIIYYMIIYIRPPKIGRGSEKQHTQDRS